MAVCGLRAGSAVSSMRHPPSPPTSHLTDRDAGPASQDEALPTLHSYAAARPALMSFASQLHAIGELLGPLQVVARSVPARVASCLLGCRPAQRRDFKPTDEEYLL